MILRRTEAGVIDRQRRADAVGGARERDGGSQQLTTARRDVGHQVAGIFAQADPPQRQRSITYRNPSLP